MILGNHFTLTYVFGKHRKLGQTEINRIGRKITRTSQKWISVSILPSNEFQDRDEEREKERARRESTCDSPSQAPAPIIDLSSLPDQALAQTPITDPSSLPNQAPA